MRITISGCSLCPLRTTRQLLSRAMSTPMCGAVSQDLPVERSIEWAPDWCPARSGVVVRLKERRVRIPAKVPPDWRRDEFGVVDGGGPDDQWNEDDGPSEQEILGDVGDK